MACKLMLVPQHMIQDVWYKVGPLLAIAMQKMQISDFTILQQQLFDGQALLWVALDGKELEAAAATQITIVHGHKYCTIIALGGRHRAGWLPLLEQLEDYASREGCAAMRIFGRAGWSRVLPNYKIVGHITERKLTCQNRALNT